MAALSCVYEVDGGLDLRQHGACGELAFLCVAVCVGGSDLVQMDLVIRAVIEGNIVNAGQEH